MKFTLWFFAVVLLATACRQHKDSPDEKMQKELSGTWVFEGKYATSSDTYYTNTVAPNGSYVCTIAIPSRTNGPRTVSLEGTFRVEKGFLIDTLTKHSQTNAPVPMTNRYRIIRIGNHELELEKDSWSVYPTNEFVFRKLRK